MGGVGGVGGDVVEVQGFFLPRPSRDHLWIFVVLFKNEKKWVFISSMLVVVWLAGVGSDGFPNHSFIS